MAKNISRRDALKNMGKAMGAVVLATSGLSAFAAAAPEKKRLVFYFTATGNSLFVAKQFSDKPLSIPQELKSDKLVYEADEIGFVFPDYAATAPLIVREFVEKATFKAPYIFSVITFGNAAVNVTEWWDNYAKEHGVVNNYINTLLMVDNYLPVFDMNQQMRIEKNTDENLAKIIADVNAGKGLIPEVGEQAGFMAGMLKQLQDSHFPMEAERLLAIDRDRCIECNTCSQVCPSGNFRIGDNGLEFSGSCEYCLACVHSCPQKALYLKAGERNREARYRHPEVSLGEIIRSNRQ